MTFSTIVACFGTAPCRTALLAAVLLAGCAGQPGHIVGALPDASFVESPEQRYLFSREHGGWLVVGLDGQIHRRLFGLGYSLEEVSADGQTFAVTNSNTDLFVAGEGGREIREVPEFHGLLGAVGLSPDGRFLAATKHADYDQPQSRWVQDERLYLIDVASLRITEVGRFVISNGRPPFGIVWLDDHSVLLQFMLDKDQLIDVRTGGREVFAQGFDQIRQSPRWLASREDRADCGMEIHVPEWAYNSTGIDLVRPGEEPSHFLVVKDARPPLGYAISDAIDNPMFTKDCRYITFEFHSGLWVAEVATGRAGPVLPGPTVPFNRWYPIGLP